MERKEDATAYKDQTQAERRIAGAAMVDDPKQGLSLGAAIREYSDPNKWRAYGDAAARAAGKRRMTLMTTGGVPIAGWDAYRRVQASNSLIDAHERAWMVVFAAFLRRLRDGELVATGLLTPLTPDTERRTIRPDLWLILKPNFWNSSAAGGGCEFAGILVSPGPMAGLPETAEAGPVVTPSAGPSFPGRPSIMRSIEEQMRSRAETGKLCDSLRAECEVLERWAAARFVDVQVPKPRSIENGIRKTYRELKARKTDTK